MEHTTVKSSRLKSVGYDYESQILEVAQKDGIIYQFSSVPANFWQEMMMAKSKGKYFFNNVKDSFPFKISRWDIEIGKKNRESDDE